MENKTADQIIESKPMVLGKDGGLYMRHDHVIDCIESFASQQCLEKQKELQLKSVAVLNLLRQNESQQAEIDRLKEECDQFAMKFLEYASGLAISNYASGGTWYLNDGSFVSTYKILEQFKSLER